MSEGFLLDLTMAMVFYRYCNKYKIENKSERLLVMRRLMAKKQAKYLRDVKTFIKDKKVLLIKKEGPLK